MVLLGWKMLVCAMVLYNYWSGAMVIWCNGALVQLGGAVVQWCCGAIGVVLLGWCYSAMVL
jgi:hypothetical protein